MGRIVWHRVGVVDKSNLKLYIPNGTFYYAIMVSSSRTVNLFHGIKWDATHIPFRARRVNVALWNRLPGEAVSMTAIF